MKYLEVVLRSILIGIFVVFSCLILGVSGAGTTDGRNRPSKVAVNGSQRLQVAGFDFAHVETPYVISLWILLASVAKIGFHLYNKLSSIFPESCLLIVMGVVVGVILYFSKAATAEKYTLSPNTFFLFLLPPIVLDAGYFMPNRAFFDNIGTILLYAVVGTLFNTVAIGAALYGVGVAGWIGAEISLLHCFVFSSLISAVDPVAVLAVFEEIHVNEMLYIIVFGESLLNDAVTVVLYHMMESYSEIGESFIEPVDIVSGVASFFVVGICGTLIGVFFGILTGFITKYTDHVRVIEPLFVFVLAYLSYLTSEMLHLSGILAIVFCGIVMKQYVEANVSQKSHTTIKYFMKMLSNISETIIFMFLGLSTVVDNHDWNFPFILFTVLFTLVFRAIGVIVLTWFANRIRLCRLSKVDQFVMSYGGLRGAIALGLVLLLNEDIVHEKRMMVTACIVVVFFTVFVQGITIKPLVNFLKVKKADKRLPSMNEQINERLMDHIMAGIEDVAGYYGHHYLRDKYELFNNKYLKPLLMRDKPKTRETKIFHVFTKLNMKEAMDHLAEHGSFNILDMAKEPSLAKIIRNYSNHSLNESGNDTLPASQTEEIEKSDTVLDMAAVEAKYSKKMADDSKIHHILDDAMFVPRRRFSTSQKHLIPDLHNHPPFKHNVRKEIRRLASISKERAKTTKSMPRSDINNTHNTDSLRQHKNVSFSHSAPLCKDKRQLASSEAESLTEDEDVGIVFTVRQTSVDSDTPDVPSHLSISAVDKTAVEKELPWRRLTSRDDRPNLSEAPSWADNLAYHGLTESGSPYSSPQNTIQKEDETTPPTVFSMFPRLKSEDTDSAVAMSTEYLNVCPATGEPSSKEEVSNAKLANVVHMRSRRNGNTARNNDVHTRHRDSGVIDSDENCDSLPKTSKPTRVENGRSTTETSPVIQTLNSPEMADTTEETKL